MRAYRKAEITSKQAAKTPTGRENGTLFFEGRMQNVYHGGFWGWWMQSTLFSNSVHDLDLDRKSVAIIDQEILGRVLHKAPVVNNTFSPFPYRRLYR